jgi:P27 family predicted phage terminase small subunit
MTEAVGGSDVPLGAVPSHLTQEIKPGTAVLKHRGSTADSHARRPPTPTHLKLLRGNPGKRALPVDEPQPLIPPTCPDPPTFLAGHAADEWWRVAPGLGLLTRIDVACLGAYCQSYARWRTAEEALARPADRDAHTGALLVRTADGNAKRNPLLRIIELEKHAGL